MNSEKMKILQMLENGKITSEQAARLLEDGSTGSKSSFKEDTNSTHNKQNSESRNNYKSNHGGKGVGLDDFVGELSRKFEVIASDWEPKLRKFTGVVVEKTSDIADKFSKKMESHQKNTTPNSSSLEQDFQIVVSSGHNEINLSGLNANVSIRGYNGDKITLKAKYAKNRIDSPIDLTCFGNRYTLNYDENDFNFVGIDAFIPESMFDIVCIESKNGNLDVSSVKTKFFKADSMNKDSKFKDITSENIKIECSNGKLSLQRISGENGQIENSNGQISVDDLDISKMKLTTSNDIIVMNVGHLSKFSEYIWALETNNAKMLLNLPMSGEIGYHLKCQTVLNDVKIGLIGLNYIINNGPLAEAMSHNYETASKKVKIALETSNAPIIIN